MGSSRNVCISYLPTGPSKRPAVEVMDGDSKVDISEFPLRDNERHEIYGLFNEGGAVLFLPMEKNHGEEDSGRRSKGA